MTREEQGAGHQRPRTRERILSEAARLFAHRGFHGTSTRDIAAATGLGQPTIYSHFPHKTEIAATLLEGELAAALQRAGQLDGPGSAHDPVGRLHALLCVELQEMDVDVRCLFDDAVLDELAPQGRSLRRLHAILEGLIERGRRAGALTGGTAALAGMLTTYLHGAAVRADRAAGRPAPSVESMADLVVRATLSDPTDLPSVRARSRELRGAAHAGVVDTPAALPPRTGFSSAISRPPPPASGVGATLRAQRVARRLTIAEVATAAHLTKGFVSRIERDQASASVAALLRLCGALDLPVGRLFDDPPPGEVVRSSAYPPIAFGGEGMREFLLTPRGERRVQAILSDVGPRGGSGDEPHSLPGDVEFAMVLEGELDLAFPTRHGEPVLNLTSGDALTFDPSLPHVFRGAGSRGARVLWVISPALPDGSNGAQASGNAAEPRKP